MKRNLYKCITFEALETRHLLAAHLIQDINQSDAGLRPQDLVRIGDTIVFLGTESSTGEELWRTDGTDEGTYLLKDIFPGQTSSRPDSFAKTDSRLFFRARTESSGSQLWATNGTKDGTVQVTNETHDRYSSRFYDTAATNDLVFFLSRINDVDEVWRSDGSSDGTFKIKEFSGSDVQTWILGTFRGRMLIATSFSQDSSTRLVQLWATDGSVAGTQLLTTTTGSHHMHQVATTETAMYFHTSNQDSALWRTDGTPQGTQPVPGFTHSVRHNSSLGDSMLLFTVHKHLKLVNEATLHVETIAEIDGPEYFVGLAESEAKVFAIIRGPDAENGLTGSFRLLSIDRNTAEVSVFGDEPITGYVNSWQVFRDELYFLEGRDRDMRLRRTNGDAIEVVHSFPDSFEVIEYERSGSVHHGIDGLTVLGDRLLLSSNSPSSQETLWATNGTSNGLTQLADTHTWLSYPMPVMMGGYLYFAAGEQYWNTELWRTDGTKNGTTIVKDYHAGTVGSAPRDFTIFNKDVYFAANDGVDHAWKLPDGNGAVRTIFTSDRNWNSVGPFIESAGELYFAGSQAEVGRELFQVNGSQSELVSDIVAGPQGSEPYHLFDVNGNLLFDTLGSFDGQGMIWTLDSRREVARRLQINGGPPIESWNFRDGRMFQGRLYFFDTMGNLISTDGVDATRIATFENDSYLQLIQVATEGMLFFQKIRQSERELWQSDGTTEGTTLVSKLPHIVQNAVAYRDNLYFATKELNVSKLWASDGTPEGTQVVHEFIFEDPWLSIGPLHVFDGRIYFGAHDDEFGAELWSTDGTSAGTHRVTDIAPGAADAGPYLFTEHDGYLYFSAADDIHGRELWRTDGTRDGTVMIQDIWPGKGGSNPTELTSLDGRLFFSADDGFHGQEPWVFEEDLPGDANSDGVVTDADYAILAQNFGRKDAGYSDGDFDRDREVSFADFLVLSTNYRT